ncbi:GCN5-related N-acetyltransferase [Thalassoporum mexicanum PCC 7367]|uniref:GNAT family N-acetyltransferase n=1 Tax=Thalassoporum mexicanum TaxID=3457544 RepID=UPI00029F92C0|nr:GNAT family N-acetyltransferase [Pseudanabaena sp. PCC 7367]AFY69552.1 GCN5-related N-acetyltransferase [Pseudanabaena sp. PCC 7367]
MPPLSRLNSNYTIRPAQPRDRQALQKLIWAFTREESWDYEIKLSLFLLKPFLVCIVLLAVLIYLRLGLDIDSNLIRLGAIFSSLGLLVSTAALIQYLAYLFGEAWFNWSKYWVIEAHESPIALDSTNSSNPPNSIESTAAMNKDSSDRQSSQLIGCAALSGGKNYRVIYQLFVTPSDRGQGLGAALADRLLQEAQPTPVYLVCKPKMQNFYARFQFKPIDWQDLPPPIKQGFLSFKPDGIYPLQIMTFQQEEKPQA